MKNNESLECYLSPLQLADLDTSISNDIFTIGEKHIIYEIPTDQIFQDDFDFQDFISRQNCQFERTPYTIQEQVSSIKQCHQTPSTTIIQTGKPDTQELQQESAQFRQQRNYQQSFGNPSFSKIPDNCDKSQTDSMFEPSQDNSQLISPNQQNLQDNIIQDTPQSILISPFCDQLDQQNQLLVIQQQTSSPLESLCQNNGCSQDVTETFKVIQQQQQQNGRNKLENLKSRLQKRIFSQTKTSNSNQQGKIHRFCQYQEDKNPHLFPVMNTEQQNFYRNGQNLLYVNPYQQLIQDTGIQMISQQQQSQHKFESYQHQQKSFDNLKSSFDMNKTYSMMPLGTYNHSSAINQDLGNYQVLSTSRQQIYEQEIPNQPYSDHIFQSCGYCHNQSQHFQEKYQPSIDCNSLKQNLVNTNECVEDIRKRDQKAQAKSKKGAPPKFMPIRARFRTIMKIFRNLAYLDINSAIKKVDIRKVLSINFDEEYKTYCELVEKENPYNSSSQIDSNGEKIAGSSRKKDFAECMELEDILATCCYNYSNKAIKKFFSWPINRIIFREYECHIQSSINTDQEIDIREDLMISLSIIMAICNKSCLMSEK